MRWGPVPFWAKDVKVGSANINAKAEDIETKPTFPFVKPEPSVPGPLLNESSAPWGPDEQ
jgi:hypothetical protein